MDHVTSARTENVTAEHISHVTAQSSVTAEIPEITDHFSPLSEEHNRVIKKGLALIINNSTFNDKNLRPRYGTDEDERRFREILECFNFRVETFKDRSRDEILSAVENVVPKPDQSFDHDCILVLVNTHGNAGGILHAKDKMYNVQDIWAPFLDNKLDHVPKIFIFQACRGASADSGIYVRSKQETKFNSLRKDKAGHEDAVEETYTVTDSADGNVTGITFNGIHPNYPNLLIGYSTVPDYLSYSTDEGTYVQSLCSVLENSKSNLNLDLVSVLTRVNREVGKMTIQVYPSNVTPPPGQYKQTPSVTSSLTYKIFLRDMSVLCPTRSDIGDAGDTSLV